MLALHTFFILLIFNWNIWLQLLWLSKLHWRSRPLNKYKIINNKVSHFIKSEYMSMLHQVLSNELQLVLPFSHNCVGNITCWLFKTSHVCRKSDTFTILLFYLFVHVETWHWLDISSTYKKRYIHFSRCDETDLLYKGTRNHVWNEISEHYKILHCINDCIRHKKCWAQTCCCHKIFESEYLP